jgi:pimeloyl-ACP methyl ester carboxylesterase
MSVCTEILASLDTQCRMSSPHYNICLFDSIGSVRLKYWVAMPACLDPSLPPLFAIHGIHRDAKGMLNEISTHMPEASRIIIAPVFDETNWRGYQRLIGRRRADLALLALLKTIRLSGLTDIRSFDLLGYSGGAQFAHRFALIYPHLINRLALCSAGWYTFPDDAPYPYGLSAPKTKLSGFNSFTRTNLECFLKLSIDVYVGEHDTEIDPNIRTGDSIDRQQGRNRLERATNWVDALNSVSKTYGFQSKAKLTVLKGCGHDFRECVRQGNLVERLFPSLEKVGH